MKGMPLHCWMPFLKNLDLYIFEQRPFYVACSVRRAQTCLSYYLLLNYFVSDWYPAMLWISPIDPVQYNGSQLSLDGKSFRYFCLVVEQVDRYLGVWESVYIIFSLHQVCTSVLPSKKHSRVRQLERPLNLYRHEYGLNAKHKTVYMPYHFEMFSEILIGSRRYTQTRISPCFCFQTWECRAARIQNNPLFSRF